MLGLVGYGTSDSEDEVAGSEGATLARAAPVPSPLPTSLAAPRADVRVAAAASGGLASGALGFDRRIAPRGVGGCSAETIARVAALRDRDSNFTESLRRNKKFGNPYLLSQVVAHFEIDETGTKFEPSEAYGAERFVDALRAQRRAAEANAQCPPPALPSVQTQTSHASGGVGHDEHPGAPAVEGPAPPPAKRRRKSRWS